MRDLIRALALEVAPEVHVCNDGESAVEMYGQVHPDCVLMDVRMRGMDGIAATRAIRQSDPGARVVIVTEFADDESRAAALAAGASEFVLKKNLLDLPRVLAGGAP